VLWGATDYINCALEKPCIALFGSHRLHYFFVLKHLIFDFGNVLFDLNLPSIEQGMRRLFGSHYEAAGRELKAQRVFELYETGGLSTDEFVDAIRTAAGQQHSAEAVVNIWNGIFIGMPRHRFDLLLQLREHYNVFLLSNINDLHARWIDDYMLREHGFNDFQTEFFDGVYYSHLIRLRKPDRDIYEYVLADAELQAGDCLFFDDLPQNIEAAQTVGIAGHVHPVGEEIAVHLKRLGIPPSPSPFGERDRW
jgi:glucose-1-phosphatase